MNGNLLRQLQPGTLVLNLSLDLVKHRIECFPAGHPTRQSYIRLRDWLTQGLPHKGVWRDRGQEYDDKQLLLNDVRKFMESTRGLIGVWGIRRGRESKECRMLADVFERICLGLCTRTDGGKQ